jgi:very-short-patch-repair endonuclease
MTPEEKILWEHLRANRLAGLHFRRQQIIAGFIVDFYCHAVGLVIEVDGPIHMQNAEYDTQRDAILTARGLRIVRFSNEEIHAHLPEVLKWIAEDCRKSI